MVGRGLVAADRWEQVTAAALELFRTGQQVAAAAGLMLADTKYEFGVTADGELLLIDEVHTPDSSRFWVADTYDARLAAGEEPESLDKEVVRRALADQGYRGDGDPPALAPDVVADTSRRYVDAFERITATPFRPGRYPVQDRLGRRDRRGRLDGAPMTALLDVVDRRRSPRRVRGARRCRRRTATGWPSSPSSGCSPCSTAVRRPPAWR